MHIVDSCGWLEWFSDGRMAEAYGEHLQAGEEILVPAVVLYEVYKILKREVGEEKALLAAGHMKTSRVVPLEDVLALQAADVALRHHLAMADAMVYAAAHMHGALLYTSDADFKRLPLVQWMGDNSN